MENGIIVYRNPLEAWVWAHLWGTIGGNFLLAVLVLMWVGLMVSIVMKHRAMSRRHSSRRNRP